MITYIVTFFLFCFLLWFLSAEKKMLSGFLSILFSSILSFGLDNVINLNSEIDKVAPIKQEKIIDEIGKKKELLFYLDYSGSVNKSKLGKKCRYRVSKSQVENLNKNVLENKKITPTDVLGVKEFYQFYILSLLPNYEYSNVGIVFFGSEINNINKIRNFSSLSCRKCNDSILIQVSNKQDEVEKELLTIIENHDGDNKEYDLSNYLVVFNDIAQKVSKYKGFNSSKLTPCDIFVIGDLYHDNNNIKDPVYYKKSMLGITEIVNIKKILDIIIKNYNVRLIFINTRYKKNYLQDGSNFDITQILDTLKSKKVLVVNYLGCVNHCDFEESVESKHNFVIVQKESDYFENSFNNFDYKNWCWRFEKDRIPIDELVVDSTYYNFENKSVSCDPKSPNKNLKFRFRLNNNVDINKIGKLFLKRASGIPTLISFNVIKKDSINSFHFQLISYIRVFAIIVLGLLILYSFYKLYKTYKTLKVKDSLTALKDGLTFFWKKISSAFSKSKKDNALEYLDGRRSNHDKQ